MSTGFWTLASGQVYIGPGSRQAVYRNEVQRLQQKPPSLEGLMKVAS